MTILGIDTSTKFLCIGVLDDAGKVYEFRLEAGKKLATILMPSIKRVLDSLDLSVKDIDYFAAGTGPGSFTGIRIGLSTIKGLALAGRKPVAGISSLDIMALNAGAVDGLVCPMVDAKRGLIYFSIYKTKPEFKRVISHKLKSPDDLLKSKGVSSCVFLGDALKLYQNEIKAKAPDATLLDEESWYPRPGNIIAIAKQRIAKGKAGDSLKLEAVYLYPKECQIRT